MRIHKVTGSHRKLRLDFRTVMMDNTFLLRGVNHVQKWYIWPLKLGTLVRLIKSGNQVVVPAVGVEYRSKISWKPNHLPQRHLEHRP